MTNAYLITGNTYPHRRTMRAGGALFDRGERGYITDSAELAERAKVLGLTVEPYEATQEQLTPATGEELRAIRQDRLNRRAARYADLAERAERRADQARDRISPHERDFLRLGEPIKVGHHSERRHRKLIERVYAATDAEMAERKKAERYRELSQAGQARVKGDAAAKYQAEVEKNEAQISLGDWVWWFGNEAQVIKINAKSYRIQVGPGRTMTTDKGSVSYSRPGELEAQAPKYKKGDAVLYQMGILNPPIPATVMRRTPTGYKISYELGGFRGDPSTHTSVVNESQLQAA